MGLAKQCTLRFALAHHARACSVSARCGGGELPAPPRAGREAGSAALNAPRCAQLEQSAARLIKSERVAQQLMASLQREQSRRKRAEVSASGARASQHRISTEL